MKRIEFPTGKAPGGGDRPNSQRGSTAVLVAGVTALVLTLVGSFLAGFIVWPPPRTTFASNTDTTALSTVGAAVALAFALASCALPRWGGVDTQSQSWKIFVLAALSIVAGLVYRLVTGAPDTDSLATTAVWCAVNLAALGTTCAAAIMRRSRIQN